MTVQAFSNWLYQALQDSLAPAPASFPYMANCGVLNAAGFDATNVFIYDYRPGLNSINQSKPNLILEIMDWDDVARTGGGARGEVTREISVAISVLWIADLSGKPNLKIAPDWPNASASQAHYRKLLNALETTLRRCTYKYMGDGQPASGNWPLTDPDTGETSWVVGERPNVKVRELPVAQSESFTRGQYIGWLECSFKEGFAVIP